LKELQIERIPLPNVGGKRGKKISNGGHNHGRKKHRKEMGVARKKELFEKKSRMPHTPKDWAQKTTSELAALKRRRSARRKRKRWVAKRQ